MSKLIKKSTLFLTLPALVVTIAVFAPHPEKESYVLKSLYSRIGVKALEVSLSLYRIEDGTESMVTTPIVWLINGEERLSPSPVSFLLTTPGEYDVAARNAADGSELLTCPKFLTVFSELPPQFEVPEMSYAIGGPFTKGNPKWDGFDGHAPDEFQPPHTVELDAFDIAIYETTNREFITAYNFAISQGILTPEIVTVMDGHEPDYISAFSEMLVILAETPLPAFLNDVTPAGEHAEISAFEDHPVIKVTWFGAALYCNWLNLAFGYPPFVDTENWTFDFQSTGFRLPTESEWEYAAVWTGNSRLEWPFYGPFRPNRANVPGTSARNLFPTTTPVGYFNGQNGTEDSQSPLGCYDMLGNAPEIVLMFSENGLGYDTFSSIRHPKVRRSLAVAKGGAWNSSRADGSLYTASSRTLPEPYTGVGFRVVRGRQSDPGSR